MWVEEASTVDISNITRFFTNQQYDRESGLYYYNARYYDPHLGSFITPDPAMDGLNHYNYCSSNPITYTDPTGLMKTQEERQQAREERQQARQEEREHRKSEGIGLITSGNNAANKAYWQSRWSNGLGSWKNSSSGSSTYSDGSPAPAYGGAPDGIGQEQGSGFGYTYKQNVDRPTGNYIFSISINFNGLDLFKNACFSLGQALTAWRDCSGQGTRLFDSKIMVTVNVAEEVIKGVNTYWVDSNNLNKRVLINRDEGKGIKEEVSFFNQKYQVKVSELDRLQSGYTYGIKVREMSLIGLNDQLIKSSDKSYINNMIKDVGYTLTFGNINPNSSHKNIINNYK